MNNLENLTFLEQGRQELLKKYDLTKESIEEFQKQIKKATPEESEKFGQEILNLLIKKNYSEKDSLDKIRELILKGANVNYQKQPQGNFPLIFCSRKKNCMETFTLLIRAGADINLKNNNQTTCVMSAARHDNPEALRLLIALGADINARCFDGDSAIMSAKRHDSQECFQILKEANAHLNLTNAQKETIEDLGSPMDFSQLLLTPKPKDKLTTAEDLEKLLDEAITETEKIVGPVPELASVKQKVYHK